MSRRRIVVAGVIAAWLATAFWLLDSAVPWGLDLPAIDVSATFGSDHVARARRYDTVASLLAIGAQAVGLVTAGIWAWRGHRFMRDSAAGPIGTGMLLGMLGLALTWAAQQPFQVVSLWWARRYDVAELGYLELLGTSWGVLTASFTWICVALLITMGLARWLGDRWWLPGAGVFVGLVALFAWSMPYWYTITERVDDRALQARFDTLERVQQTGDVPLRIEEVSSYTDQINAYAFGVANTRTVVLWDTLVDGSYTDAEVDIVLAHELAHHAGDHLGEAIAWFALFALPGSWLVMRATRRRGGLGEPAAVPLALLAAAVFSFVTSPMQGAISRSAEREADWRALEATRNPAAARALFTAFSETSLGDPDPPWWSQVLLGSHPALADRIAMADAWARRCVEARRADCGPARVEQPDTASPTATAPG